MRGKVWWVNQGATYGMSKVGGYLWAPVRSSRGVERTYWKTMAEVRKDDVIVHCSKGRVLALSKATSGPHLSERPEAFRSEAWTDDAGRRIEVEYFILNPAIMVEAVAPGIMKLEIHQGPLNKNGKPKQSYLHRFSEQGLRLLQKAASGEWPTWAGNNATVA